MSHPHTHLRSLRRQCDILNLIILFFSLLLLVGCARPEPTPNVPTGVHLQASFEVPELVNGQPRSHPTMNYLIYFPQGYRQDSEQGWPLIVFLHGAGDDDNDSAFVISQGLPQVLYLGEQPQDFPFIVVSPQAFFNTAWWSGDTLAVLNLLLDEVIEKYNVDPQRIYLTGLSMGGYGAWFLASAFPDRFAAVVSVSGSGFRTPRLPPDSMLCGMKTPVWIIHGEQDRISQPEIARTYALGLVERCSGSEVKFTMYPDAGHLETFYRAYRDPAIYQWMLEHSR